MEASLDHFWDEAQGGFFLTADDGEELIVRPKEAYDGAIPSGNSVQFLNLLRLARLTGRTTYETQADALARWMGAQVRSRPTGFTALLAGLEFAVGDAREVVIAGERRSDDTQALLDVLHSEYGPFTVVLHRPPGDAPPIAELAPFTEAQTPVDGQAAAYVCRDFACEAPTTDPETLRGQLAPSRA